ncbi:MAG: hypothetical protein E6R07_07515 [Nevskiaceae bacterium]|nr:MAG: hypothetical protein E6R07_07515 [Nevskiaceae bacterium]
MALSRDGHFPRHRPARTDPFEQRHHGDGPGLKAIEREISALITERERIFAKKKSLPANAQRKSRIKFILDSRLAEIRVALAMLYAHRQKIALPETDVADIHSC